MTVKDKPTSLYTTLVVILYLVGFVFFILRTESTFWKVFFGVMGLFLTLGLINQYREKRKNRP